MSYCKSILLKTLIVKSFSKCKRTNLGTIDGLEQVNGLNGTTDAKWENMIKLNDHTGDLTIRNIQTEHSGDYDLEINNSSMILHRKLHIAVSGEWLKLFYHVLFFYDSIGFYNYQIIFFFFMVTLPFREQFKCSDSHLILH